MCAAPSMIASALVGSARWRRSASWTGKPMSRLRGKQPEQSASQRRHLLNLHHAGEHTPTELAEPFNISRTTVYREIQRGSGLASTV